jgi:hypothetical protein
MLYHCSPCAYLFVQPIGLAHTYEGAVYIYTVAPTMEVRLYVLGMIHRAWPPIGSVWLARERLRSPSPPWSVTVVTRATDREPIQLA